MSAPYVLSIQSEVVYGHVGLGAARFALQRLGFEVLALPTVLLSHHPGHGPPAGETISADRLQALLRGLQTTGVLAQTVGVLSGYLGAPAQTEVVAEAVRLVKSANPKAVYLCDPVFGDEGGAYAKPGVAEAMARRLIPLADIATPNRFELVSLTARQVDDLASAQAAAKALGVGHVVATSTPWGPGTLGAAVFAGGQAWRCGGPQFAQAPHGTGDVFAALYLGWLLRGQPIEIALQRATSAVQRLIELADRDTLLELPLIAGQDHLLSPPLLPVYADGRAL